MLMARHRIGGGGVGVARGERWRPGTDDGCGSQCARASARSTYPNRHASRLPSAMTNSNGSANCGNGGMCIRPRRAAWVEVARASSGHVRRQRVAPVGPARLASSRVASAKSH
jgi:hypothetical protein